MYEPYLNGLSRRLLMPLPSWGVGVNSVENWKTVWGRISSEPSGPVSPPSSESDHF